MSDERFTVASPKAIEGLIEAWSSFTPATRARALLMRRILGAWPPPGGG